MMSHATAGQWALVVIGVLLMLSGIMLTIVHRRWRNGKWSMLKHLGLAAGIATGLVIGGAIMTYFGFSPSANQSYQAEVTQDLAEQHFEVLKVDGNTAVLKGPGGCPVTVYVTYVDTIRKYVATDTQNIITGPDKLVCPAKQPH